MEQQIVDDLAQEDLEEDLAQEDIIQRTTTAVFIARCLYIASAVCFGIALGALIVCYIQVNALIGDAQGWQVLLNGFEAAKHVLTALMVWLLTVVVGLLSLVSGLLVYSFAE